METATTFVEDSLNGVLWNIVPVFLIAAGVYFGFRTLFVQIRLIPDMLKAVAETPKGKDREGRDLDEEYGGVSAFKAFTISAASRVGTGNIAGVALAISIGGPGSVFWMWLLALLGGATAFVESTLAQLWKTKDAEGNYHGGPAYYMTRGLGWRPLAVLFSAFLALTYGFVYNAIQTNSITAAIETSVGNDSVLVKSAVAGVLAILTALVIFGGVTRIASWTQVIVPFMAGAYIIMGVVVLVVNWREIPAMFELIVTHALGLKEVAGAGVWLAFTQGMRRGLFSNEAGMGSAPNAAASATVSHPVKQGLVQTLGVYFDTLLVCTITAFIVLLGPAVSYGMDDVQGVSLTQSALADSLGDWSAHAITAILFFLAFSSVIGNYYLAQTNLEYLTESKSAQRLPHCCHRVCHLRRVRLRPTRVGARRHHGWPAGHLQHRRHHPARRRGAEAAEELQRPATQGHRPGVPPRHAPGAEERGVLGRFRPGYPSQRRRPHRHQPGLRRAVVSCKLRCHESA